MIDVSISLDLSLNIDYSGNPYERVTPVAAISLVERIREAEKRRANNTSSFLHMGNSKRPERGRRRRLDDILKQLKDLQSASTGGGGPRRHSVFPIT